MEKSAALWFSLDIIKAYLITPVKLCWTIIFEALMKKVLFLEKNITSLFESLFEKREILVNWFFMFLNNDAKWSRNFLMLKRINLIMRNLWVNTLLIMLSGCCILIINILSIRFLFLLIILIFLRLRLTNSHKIIIYIKIALATRTSSNFL